MKVWMICPQPSVAFFPTESEFCTDQVLIEVRIFNEDQMVCNVEGASFYELRIAGNCRKGRSGFWCFWCVFSGLALATMHAGVPLKNSRAIWQDPGPCSGSSHLRGKWSIHLPVMRSRFAQKRSWTAGSSGNQEVLLESSCLVNLWCHAV